MPKLKLCSPHFDIVDIALAQHDVHDFKHMVSICLILLLHGEHVHTEHALNDLKGMLSVCLKNKITSIRPMHLKKLIYFLVPKSNTHTGLDCVKNSATTFSCLGPFKH